MWFCRAFFHEYRFHNTSRQTGLGKGNFAEQAAKIEAIKEEQDDAQTKVEQCKVGIDDETLILICHSIPRLRGFRQEQKSRTLQDLY